MRPESKKCVGQIGAAPYKTEIGILPGNDALFGGAGIYLLVLFVDVSILGQPPAVSNG